MEENYIIYVIIAIEHLHRGFMYYPKASRKFIGLITTHNRHGNCQILEIKLGGNKSSTTLYLKLTDTLHLGTLVLIDSISPYLFTGPLYVRKSD